MIDGRDDVHAIAHVDDPSDAQGNTVDAVLSGGVPMARTHKADRRFFATSSCGICGKESIDQILQTGLTVATIPMPDPDLICGFPQALRSGQAAFAQTGGIHAAGLFTLDGECVVVREDVGRHNAVDKVIGHALEKEIFPCRHLILVLSGRAGFELIQKAAMAQIPLVVAIGAPSSLAVSLAQRLGMGLVGFTKSNRFNVYSSPKMFLSLFLGCYVPQEGPFETTEHVIRTDSDGIGELRLRLPENVTSFVATVETNSAVYADSLLDPNDTTVMKAEQWQTQNRKPHERHLALFYRQYPSMAHSQCR